MQVHNLVDVQTHLATLREWKQQGRIRYLGITHHEAGAFPDVEKIMRSEKLDFLQINYSLAERESEKKILEICKDKNIAVIANRPFAEGAMFRRVRGKPLPPWAAEIGVASWAQYFLKWIVGHPRHLHDPGTGSPGTSPTMWPPASARCRMKRCASAWWSILIPYEDFPARRAVENAMSSAGFYAGLPVLTEFDAVADAASYAPLPADWHVATCDVRNSTWAVEAGHYKHVNTVGASAVTAMLNAAGDIDIPFIFEGDGSASACRRGCSKTPRRRWSRRRRWRRSPSAWFAIARRQRVPRRARHPGRACGYR
jgi:hypothetical protein